MQRKMLGSNPIASDRNGAEMMRAQLSSALLLPVLWDCASNRAGYSWEGIPEMRLNPYL